MKSILNQSPLILAGIVLVEMVAYSPSETHSCGKNRSPYPASHNFNDNVTKDSSDLPTFATCTEIRRHGQSLVFFLIDGMYTPLKSNGWNLKMSPWKRKLPWKSIHFGGPCELSRVCNSWGLGVFASWNLTWSQLGERDLTQVEDEKQKVSDLNLSLVRCLCL